MFAVNAIARYRYRYHIYKITKFYFDFRLVFAILIIFLLAFGVFISVKILWISEYIFYVWIGISLWIRMLPARRNIWKSYWKFLSEFIVFRRFAWIFPIFCLSIIENVCAMDMFELRLNYFFCFHSAENSLLENPTQHERERKRLIFNYKTNQFRFVGRSLVLLFLLLLLLSFEKMCNIITSLFDICSNRKARCGMYRVPES